MKAGRAIIYIILAVLFSLGLATGVFWAARQLTEIKTVEELQARRDEHQNLLEEKETVIAELVENSDVESIQLMIDEINQSIEEFESQAEPLQERTMSLAEAELSEVGAAVETVVEDISTTVEELYDEVTSEGDEAAAKEPNAEESGVEGSGAEDSNEVVANTIETDAEDSSTEDTNTEEIKAEETGAEDTRTKESKIEEVGAEDTNAKDANAKDANAKDANAEDTKVEASDTVDTDTDNSKSSDSQGEESKVEKSGVVIGDKPKPGNTESANKKKAEPKADAMVDADGEVAENTDSATEVSVEVTEPDSQTVEETESNDNQDAEEAELNSKTTEEVETDSKSTEETETDGKTTEEVEADGKTTEETETTVKEDSENEASKETSKKAKKAKKKKKKKKKKSTDNKEQQDNKEQPNQEGSNEQTSDLLDMVVVDLNGRDSLNEEDTVAEDDQLGTVELTGYSALEAAYIKSQIMTLEEHKSHYSSVEETILINAEDQEVIAANTIDFSRMKIACLGDSITAAANLESMEDYQQYSYPYQLQQILGAASVTNLGIGGSSIGRYWADPFVERYQDIPEDTDLIIVMGGTNDGFCVTEKEFGSLEQLDYRTFCGDLDELMRGLRVNYPNAKIIFATPLPNVLHNILRAERNYLLPQYYFVDAIIDLALKYKIEFIDLYDSNLLDANEAEIVTAYVPDGVHPNSDGYKILAEHFAAEIIRMYQNTAVDETETMDTDTVSIEMTSEDLMNQIYAEEEAQAKLEEEEAQAELERQDEQTQQEEAAENASTTTTKKSGKQQKSAEKKEAEADDVDP